jgi:hypothetical protein
VLKAEAEMNVALQIDKSTLLLETPKLPISRLRVKFENKGPDPNKPDHVVPVLVGQVNALVETSADIDTVGFEPANEHRMLLFLKEVLRVFQYRRGRVQMRVIFGSFLLKEYRKSEVGFGGTLDDFREILRDPNTVGQLEPK